MRTQQQAERAEQQRIKNLVLNYDLTDDQQDGEEPAFHYVLSPSTKRTRLVGKGLLNASLKPPQRQTFGQLQHFTNCDSRGDDDGGPAPDDTVGSPAVPVDAKQRIDSFADETGAIEGMHGPQRFDKSGNTRSKQRARKLQLGDIDWYGTRSPSAVKPADPPTQASLNDYIVDKNPKRGGRDLGRGRGDRRDSRPTG